MSEQPKESEAQSWSSFLAGFGCLLLVIATATQNELARQIKYLKVENQILRSKLPGRITITPQERHRLVHTALGLQREQGVAMPRHQLGPV